MDKLQETAPAAMKPSQGPSNPLTSETIDMTDTTEKGKLSFDAHAVSVVYGLCYFGCNSRVIHTILESYGFKCSLRDVSSCIYRSGLVKYDRLPRPLEGTSIERNVLANGVEAILTKHYVNGEPTMLSFQYGPLRPRTPFYGQRLSTDDGRQFTVEITKDWLSIRALNHPDPDVKLS